ncbi:MAG: hypothetical protein HYS07_08910, partial [Chlamydiae bacterium]|nr:hypothetical protein [Chlamydiota bacterium]
VCEIKYTEAAVGTEVINEMDRKLELLLNPKKKSIQRILIAPFGATKALDERHYFDRIITLKEIF